MWARHTLARETVANCQSNTMMVSFPAVSIGEASAARQLDCRMSSDVARFEWGAFSHVFPRVFSPCFFPPCFFPLCFFLLCFFPPVLFPPVFFPHAFSPPCFFPFVFSSPLRVFFPRAFLPPRLVLLSALYFSALFFCRPVLFSPFRFFLKRFCFLFVFFFFCSFLFFCLRFFFLIRYFCVFFLAFLLLSRFLH